MVQAGLTVRTCYLPGTEADVWYNAATGSRHAGGAQVSVPVTLSDMPVFIRGGSVVPRRVRWARRRASHWLSEQRQLARLAWSFCASCCACLSAPVPSPVAPVCAV